MKIKYLAHSSFLLTSSAGVKIVTDPFTPGFANFTYYPINETADIVTVSHAHEDHNNINSVKGHPVALTKAGIYKIKDIEINGINTFHDDSGGRYRGGNIVFRFTIDNLNLCHLGDLGHRMDSAQLAELANVDIVMIPVGGVYTIDPSTAGVICDDLKARLIIPMHYKTPKGLATLASVDDFIKGKTNVRKINSSEFEVDKQSLPAGSEIILLQSAL